MENSNQYFENYFTDNFNSKLLNLSDGILKTEDGRCFKIHKYTLAKNSKYFYALFCSIDCGTDDILMYNIKGDTLSNILLYIYTRKIHVTPGNICDLIVASDYLLLDNLLFKLKGKLKMNLTNDNCLQIFDSCLAICKEEMWRDILRFIQVNFESILSGKDCEICYLTAEILKMLIGEKNLHVTSERSVWVEGDTHSRLNDVPELLMYLAIGDMDETLATEILDHDIVALNQNCKELYEAKLFLKASNLEALQYYVKSRPSHLQTSYNNRQPAKIHYVAYYRSRKSIEMFVTFDENIDIWRPLFKAETSPDFMMTLHGSLYIFQSKNNRNWRYNAVERQLSEMSDFITQRSYYVVVALNGWIYILGGISRESGAVVYDVEYFNPLTNMWYTTTPMIPVSSFSAVRFDNSIFAVGSNETDLGDEMITQLYDPSPQVWNRLPSLPSTIFEFSMVVFQQRIYVIQPDRKDVEVFDPSTNEWNRGADLPYRDNRDYLVRSPPIYWNIPEECWEPFQKFENSSVMKFLPRHYIITVEDSETINAISNENKEREIRFVNSNF